MSLRFRAFVWGGVLLMGVLANHGIAWAQVTEDVVVIPKQRTTVRKIGDVFRDCPECPEMVILPPGTFLMGSRAWAERPQHLVTIGQPIAVGRYEVTFAEWEACVREGGCNGYKPRDEKWGRGNRPVINVDWSDAQSYVSWLSRKTGKPYRLLSEAEWEYAARAGTTTEYYWGDDPQRSAICAYANVGPIYYCADEKRSTLPVGSFHPNNFGLYDMSGNVLEWTADCWNDNYAGAPFDGRARQEGNCKLRPLRGGSWYEHARMDVVGPFRSAARHYMSAGRGTHYVGFRVARTMAVAPNPYRKPYPRGEQPPSREQRERREIEPKQPSRERPESRVP